MLRRLLRRAARHGKLLGVNKPFLYQVVETVIEENENHYTYLRERADHIIRVVKNEEENFARTIDTGMRIFGESWLPIRLPARRCSPVLMPSCWLIPMASPLT